MSVPTAPPPQYTDSPSSPTKTYGATPSAEPLLAAQRGGLGTASGSSGNAWMDQPNDEADDFKYGVNVADSDLEIRMGFIRKVYSILFVQLLATTIVSALLRFPSAKAFTQTNSWIIYLPMIGSFIALGGVYWKRHEHPMNLILLGVFTLCESLLVGTVTSYYESTIVLQALLITLGVFAGLTLFTFQTKYDFSSFGPFLFAGLIGLMTAGLVQIFLPFNETVDLVVSCIGVVIFSGYICYDTQNIQKRCSVDEYVLASLMLYLDVLNLFLYILRVLNNTERR